MAAGSPFRGTAAIEILDLPICFVSRASDDGLVGAGEPHRDVRKRSLQFRKHIPLQISISRIFRSKMDRDHKGLPQLRQRALVGYGKRISTIFSNVDARFDL